MFLWLHVWASNPWTPICTALKTLSCLLVLVLISIPSLSISIWIFKIYLISMRLKPILDFFLQKKWSEVKSLSHVWLFVIPWTVAYQAPPSLGFSRQEYWSGLPFPSPGDLPNPGIKPGSPVLQADALPSEPSGKSLLPSEVDLKFIISVCNTKFLH